MSTLCNENRTIEGKYKLLRKEGKGGFGEVYSGSINRSGFKDRKKYCNKIRKIIRKVLKEKYQVKSSMKQISTKH